MVVVAVAGGTGGIGGAIVDALRPSPYHKMIILTRRVPNTPQETDTFVTLDYSDVDAMAKALDDNNVHTVISALRVFDSASSEAESNLVKATANANSPKRFIASAWGIEYADTTPVGQARGRTLVQLQKTDLEWTRFDNGFFLDYYGPPTLKSYMQRVAWALDIANKKAGIPGTGNEPMTFTYTLDVAKFVVAALDLPRWEKLIWGPKNNDFKADKKIGSKFDITYDPAEKLEKGEVTELPFNKNAADLPQKVLEGLMSLWGLYVLEGKYDMPTDKAINKLFPDIQPLKVEDVLGMWRYLLMVRTQSCWTCRLRRKKCDQGQPACQTCSALSIQCHNSPDRPDWMDGGEKQDEMTRRFKAQVKQRKERHYVQILSIGDPNGASAASTERRNVHTTSEHYDPPVWKFEGIPAVDAFQGLDVDFTMVYMDHTFPFLFPFYAPSMIQGGRAWVLDMLRHNKTMFYTAMGLSTYFFTLVLSSKNMSNHQVCRQNIWTQLEGYANDAIKSLQTEVLAINQQESVSMMQRARGMQSIAQQMFLEMAMAKSNESSMHLAAAISIFEDILQASKVNGRMDMTEIMVELEKPSWVPLSNQRPVWNTEQAALRFYFAILLWADIVSSTSLQTVPRLWKYYPGLISHDHGGTATDGLLRMEEYVGCEGWTLIAIAEVATLDIWKQEQQRNGQLNDRALVQRKEYVEGLIREGLRELDERCSTQETQPQRIIQSFYRSSDPNHLIKQAAATRIWAHAAQIYLTIVTTGWKPDTSSVRESASEVLRLLQELEDPAILRSAVWPFCVAGCVADEDILPRLIFILISQPQSFPKQHPAAYPNLGPISPKQSLTSTFLHTTCYYHIPFGMDERTKKQVANCLARHDVRGDEKNEDPDQDEPKPQSQPQSTAAAGTANLAERLPIEPKSEAIPELKLTSDNLAILNQQLSRKASNSKKAKSVCSDAASHGAASGLSREASVYIPPPPSIPDPADENDWVLKKYPCLGRVSKKGVSAAVAYAALREMGDCD
ncbi:hypothetical protein FANTH_1239 [Fusarium anthophilum]|uniref:Zn(2)-C6 fungal-type domain-containing protein n=1 Tax=Fusarium anthophilum TaxID=48485 RepID=A0A8H4ZWF5_9HYPO|nr:hypothetical protein FANTH_1239 [Fusarium anthophilum]